MRSVFCKRFKFGSLGISFSGDIERVERIFLPISSGSVGVYPFSGGVDLYDKNAKYGSSGFLAIFFGSLNCSFHLSVALRVGRAACDVSKTPFFSKF